MRSIRAVPLALTVLTSLALAACGGGSGSAGWTYAPAPSTTPAASGGASGEPSGAPSAEPGGSPAASPGGEPSPGGESPTVTAQNVAYDVKDLTVGADEPFSIHFVNEDVPGTPHDIDIRDANGETLQDQDTIDGGTDATYEYTALPAGQYVFICSIHPIDNMTGTLTVE